jgi:secreted trypsin-like serine protease
MRTLHRLLAATIVLSAVLISAAAPASAPAAGKVTNGTDVSDGLYASHLRPLVALIYASADDQWDGQFCAGTLIDETHVLTAGHCIVDDEGGLRKRQAPSSILVFAGSKRLNTSTMDRTNLVPVTSIFVHPNFNIRTMRWDSAILRLGRPITNVPVMPRLTAEDVAALGMGTNQVDALVAGWGDTNPNLDDCCFPTTMKSVGVPIHPNSTCATNLANAPGILFDQEFQVCAGRLGTGGRLGADTCQGDSGGPLIVDVNGVPKHAGVTSFGVGCGQRFLGVYARTTALNPWIDSIPGIVAGDTRDETHGPGDTAAPTVTATPLDFTHARLTITPAATGAPVSQYTVWARDGAPRDAMDIFRGTTSSLTYDVKLPPVNSNEQFNVLVRPYGAEIGDGPSANVRTHPVPDLVRPSVPTGVRAARSGAFIAVTWNRASDRQSGIGGYLVQRKVNGRWARPQIALPNRLRIRVGTAHGAVRVLSVDAAGNYSAWSAAKPF